MRIFHINKIKVVDASVHMESVLDPWSENDQIVANAIGDAFDEHVSLGLWIDWAKGAGPGEVFLDIGTYSGIFALAAANPAVKVLAFEPSTITFGRLARNILLNNFDVRVIPVNHAAGASLERTHFPHRYGIYSLCSGESHSTKDYGHAQPVTVVPVDCLLELESKLPYLDSRSIPIFPFGRVAGVKIDVEGAELSVLEGTRGLIARDRPFIVAEAPSDDFAEALARLAGELGYRSQKVGSGAGHRRVGEPGKFVSGERAFLVS